MSGLQSLIQQYGGLTGVAKQGGKDRGIMEMLGLGGLGGGMQTPATGALNGEMPSSVSTGMLQSLLGGGGGSTEGADGLGSMIGLGAGAMGAGAAMGGAPQAGAMGGAGSGWNRLGDWGAGVSKASGATYGPPKTFGEVMAGGNDALMARDQQSLGNRKTEAEIGALNNRGVDFDSQLQNILVKENMGVPLTPQEQAHKQAWNSINQTKTSFGTDALGNMRMGQRTSLPGTSGGQQPRGLPSALNDPAKLEEYKKLRGL